MGILIGYLEHHAHDLAGPHRVLDAAPEGTSTCLDVATHRTVAVDSIPLAVAVAVALEPVP